MLIETVNVDDIQIGVSASGWEDAVRKSAQTLLDRKSIEPSYINAMIETVKENGPYMVISKHIALAHARPECGVNEMALSFATLTPPIDFGAGDFDPIKLVVTLAATDNESHLEMIAELAGILIDENKLNAMFEAASKEELYKLLES